MDTRTRATALLDVLGVGTQDDRTHADCNRARAFTDSLNPEAVTQPGRAAKLLRDGLTDPEAAAAMAKITRYPIDAFAWTWADRGQGHEGSIDLRMVAGRRTAHPWEHSDVTAMGAALGWWIAPKVPRGTLVLSSDTGSGKTVAAVYVAVRRKGVFLRAADLGEIALGKGSGLLTRLSYEPLLVIDELGRESDIRPTPQRITELLGTRHDRGLATMITTQLPKTHTNPESSFSDRYGAHVLDRVVRAGTWIDIRMPSRRGAGRPRLDGLIRSCRVAELVHEVQGLTSAQASGDSRPVVELQRLMGVTDEAVQAAADERAAWTMPLIREAQAMPGVAGDIVRRVLAGDPAKGGSHAEE